MSTFSRYHIGDVVKIKGDEKPHIISDISINWDDDFNASFEIATNRSAWHSLEEVTLIKQADEASLRQLGKDNNDEMYEEIL